MSATPLTTDVSLSLQVLGPLSAQRDGAELALGGPRQRAVLGRLVVARGDAVPADRLIDALWPEEAPRNAPAVLQSYVSHLRRALEPGRSARDRDAIIVSAGGGYACRLPDDAVDAWRFERLLRAAHEEPQAAVRHLSDALALWRGPAYAEYAGEPWADAEAGRLDELRAVAREQLLAARLATGEAALLVPELEALTAEEPLREERWRLLALALYRAHRQADALAALRRARTTLADELGVDPGPALRGLEAEILAQSPTLEAIPTQRPGQRPAPSPVPDDLMDRDREVAELRACLADALAGHGQAVLLEGPAGIGKTRLLAESRRLAQEHGARQLAARGSQLEKEYGFGVVRQLFEPLLSDPATAGRLLSGAAGSAAGVFGAGEAGVDGSFAVLHGLYWLTVNLSAEAPLVLLVDDLQWCDSASLRFLAYLTRRLDGLPVLVCATLRTGEAYDDAGLLAELVQDPALVAVRPRPLTAEGVGDLVRSRLGQGAEEPFVLACHRVTRGNPLLVRQLLRALEAEHVRPDALHAETVTAIGSRAISGLVLMRLQRLPGAATAVARGAAVLGDGATLPAVAALAGVGEDAAAAAIDALTRAEVLRDQLPLGFVHPLVREAVYRDLSPGERTLHHERAAQALDAAGAPAEQVAAHLLQVPPRGSEWTVRVLRRAAATAAERGAAESGVAYLRRALAEPPPPADLSRVLLELGHLGALADAPAATAHLRAAYDLLAEPAQKATAALLLAQVLVFAGERGEATELARRAATALPDDLIDERQGLLALEKVGAYMHGLPAADWRGGHVPIQGDGIGARMLAAQQAWDLVVSCGDRHESTRLARFALAGGLLQSVDPGLFWVIAGVVLDTADEPGSPWDDAVAGAHARGSLLGALAAHLWRGYEAWQQGDLREAQHALQVSNEQSRLWGAPRVGVPYGSAFLAEVLIARGDLAGAREALRGEDDGPRIGDGARLMADAEVRLLVAEGRYDEALALQDRQTGLALDIVNPVWRPWRSLRAAALAGLGRTDEARELVDQELALARRWGAPRLVGRTLRQLGALQTGPCAEATLREALAVLAPTSARLELARAIHALATVTADPAEADALRLQALELSRAGGADPLRDCCTAELQAVGAPVPPEPQDGALTRTEQRIAALHRSGADAHAIAQQLFLTPGSVLTVLERLQTSG